MKLKTLLTLLLLPVYCFAQTVPQSTTDGKHRVDTSIIQKTLPGSISHVQEGYRMQEIYDYDSVYAVHKLDSNILGGYQSRYLWLADSALIMSNFGLYVRYQDTLAMLAPYLRKADAANTYYLQSNPANYVDNIPNIDSSQAIWARVVNLPAYPISTTNITHWNTAYNKYVVSAAFNSVTGNYTLTLNDATTVTANLDGRYLQGTDTSHLSARIDTKVDTGRFTRDSAQNVVNIADTSGRLQASLNNKLEYPVYDTITIFNTNLQNSLPAGFTLTGTHGTFTSNGLLFNGNTGNYTDYIEYNTATMVEKCMQSITFVWQGKTNTDYGIQVGFHSINPFGYEHTVNGAWISSRATVFTGCPAFDINEGHSTLIGSLVDTAYSVGDTMRYDLFRYETTYTITVTNITKKWVINYTQSTTPSGSPFSMHNTSKPRISDLAINALVINWNYKILKPHGLNAVFIGNSIMGGQAADASTRFVNLTNGYTKSVVSGGGADGLAQAVAAVQEKITLAPKYALIMMGGNDLLFAVDSNTWQSNYQKLRDSLAHAGETVIHLLPTPRNNTDERPLKNFILRTYTGIDHIIDTWTPLWDNTTLDSMLPAYNSGDGVHPNTAGHALIAATINADTFFKQQYLPQVDSFNSMATHEYVGYSVNNIGAALITARLNTLSFLGIKGFINTPAFEVGAGSHPSSLYAFINSDSTVALVTKNAKGVDNVTINGSDGSITFHGAPNTHSPRDSLYSRNPIDGKTDLVAYPNMVDSLHISNDSVYYCKSGVCTFSYMRTSGTGGGVSSWNSRTGAVVPANGDYSTNQVTENTNLYFTYGRVLDDSISGSGPAPRLVTAAGLNTAQALDVKLTDTTVKVETPAQTNTKLANYVTTNDTVSGAGAYPNYLTISYLRNWAGSANVTTLGTITAGTWNGTAIANANLANSTISGISLGSNLATLTISSPLTGTSYNGGTAVSIGIQTASGTQSGAISSTDWNTFNGKLSTNQTITFAPTGDVTGTTTGGTSLAPVLSIGAAKVTNAMLAGSIDLTTKVTGALPSANIAATLTSKRITPRIGSTTSSATPAPDGDNNDVYEVTALAAGATFGAPTGTPTDGQGLVLRIKDNGTARTLAWNAIYRAGTDFALPTTTVISKTIYLYFIYNSADSKWDAVGLTQGF